MAKTTITGYSLRKLETAVRLVDTLPKSKTRDQIASRLKEVLEDAKTPAVKKAPRVPIESKDRFLNWLRVWRALQSELALPEFDGNVWKQWTKWYRTDQWYAKAGKKGPWFDEDLLRRALAKEADWNLANTDFGYLCGMSRDQPAIRRMVLNVQERKPSKPSTPSLEDIRREAEEAF